YVSAIGSVVRYCKRYCEATARGKRINLLCRPTTAVSPGHYDWLASTASPVVAENLHRRAGRPTARLGQDGGRTGNDVCRSTVVVCITVRRFWLIPKDISPVGVWYRCGARVCWLLRNDANSYGCRLVGSHTPKTAIHLP